MAGDRIRLHLGADLAPASDTTDDLEFTQAADSFYRYGLASCSDTSNTTLWSDSDENLATGFQCLAYNNKTSSGGNPGSQPIFVGFGPVTTQTYNLLRVRRVSVQVR